MKASSSAVMALRVCAGATGGLLLEPFFVDPTAATSARGTGVVLLCLSSIGDPTATSSTDCGDASAGSCSVGLNVTELRFLMGTGMGAEDAVAVLRGAGLTPPVSSDGTRRAACLACAGNGGDTDRAVDCDASRCDSAVMCDRLPACICAVWLSVGTCSSGIAGAGVSRGAGDWAVACQCCSKWTLMSMCVVAECAVSMMTRAATYP